ncbi:MAG: tetratricopeptide repeat protein [Anaerolineae bacterium]|nr:tetratricopeptide repeat protein [Anaerolineae bacterium]
MRKRQRGRVVLIVAVLLSSLLAACGAEQPSPAAPTAGASQAADEHFQKGNELFDQGKFEEAIDEYGAALEEDPDNVSVLVNLGVAYYNSGELDQAVEKYNRALELAPDDADIHSNLGAAYVQQQDLQAGLEEYQRAIELDPNLAQAYFGLGVIHDGLGQPEDAIAAFEKFQELDAGQDAFASDLAQQYLERLKGQ